MSTSLTPDQARAMASAALRDSRLRRQQHLHPNSSEQDLNASISDASIRTFDDLPQTPRRQLFPEGGPVRSLSGTPGRRVSQEEAKVAAMKELHDAEVEFRNIARTEAIRRGLTSQDEIERFVRSQLNAVFGDSEPQISSVAGRNVSHHQSIHSTSDSFEYDGLSTIVSEDDTSACLTIASNTSSELLNKTSMVLQNSSSKPIRQTSNQLNNQTSKSLNKMKSLEALPESGVSEDNPIMEGKISQIENEVEEVEDQHVTNSGSVDVSDDAHYNNMYEFRNADADLINFPQVIRKVNKSSDHEEMFTNDTESNKNSPRSLEENNNNSTLFDFKSDDKIFEEEENGNKIYMAERVPSGSKNDSANYNTDADLSSDKNLSYDNVNAVPENSTEKGESTNDEPLIEVSCVNRNDAEDHVFLSAADQNGCTEGGEEQAFPENVPNESKKDCATNTFETDLSKDNKLSNGNVQEGSSSNTAYSLDADQCGGFEELMREKIVSGDEQSAIEENLIAVNDLKDIEVNSCDQHHSDLQLDLTTEERFPATNGDKMENMIEASGIYSNISPTTRIDFHLNDAPTGRTPSNFKGEANDEQIRSGLEMTKTISSSEKKLKSSVYQESGTTTDVDPKALSTDKTEALIVNNDTEVDINHNHPEEYEPESLHKPCVTEDDINIQTDDEVKQNHYCDVEEKESTPGNKGKIAIDVDSSSKIKESNSDIMDLEMNDKFSSSFSKQRNKSGKHKFVSFRHPSHERKEFASSDAFTSRKVTISSKDVPENIAWTVPPKHLMEIIDSIRSGSLLQRSNACGVLKMMSSKKANQVSLARTRGLIDVLILAANDSFESETDISIDIRARVMAIISNLSSSVKNRSFMYRHQGVLPLLVSTLEQDYQEARAIACSALAYMAKVDENKISIINTNNVLSILSWILSGNHIGPYASLEDDDESSKASGIVSTELEDEYITSETKSDIEDSENVKEVADEEECGKPQGCEEDHSVISKLTIPSVMYSDTALKTTQKQLKVYRKKGKVFLLPTRVNACAVLLQLVRHSNVAEILAHNEAFMKALIGTIQEDKLPIHSKLLEMMCHLTQLHSVTQKLIDYGNVLTRIVGSAKSLTAQDRVWSLRIIQNLSCLGAGRRVLLESSLLDCIVASTTRRGQQDEQIAALGILHNFAFHHETVIIVAGSFNCISSLTVLSAAEDRDIRNAACNVLAMISYWLQEFGSECHIPDEVVRSGKSVPFPTTDSFTWNKF